MRMTGGERALEVCELPVVREHTALAAVPLQRIAVLLASAAGTEERTFVALKRDRDAGEREEQGAGDALARQGRGIRDGA
jgi:hypothetical protein